MATDTLDELTAPLTIAEIKTSIYSALAIVGVTTTTWKPGAVTRTIIAVVCVILHALSRLIHNLARAAHLGLAGGAWLSRRAFYVFNTQRFGESLAQGTVLVSNSSGSPHSLNPDALTVTSSVTGKSYLNAEAVIIAAGAVDVPVTVYALEAGSASSALIGEIDRVTSGQSGLTVRNAEVLVGLDAEDDESLRARASAKVEPLSPEGAAGAYGHVARNARRPDGSLIGVTRVRPVVRPGGFVDVYVATAAGALAPADLAIVDELLQIQCAALTVTLNVYNATLKPIDVSYKVWAYRGPTGLREDTFKTAIVDSLAAYLAPIDLGGFGESEGIYHDDLRAEINHARYKDTPLRIFRVQLDTPAGNVPLQPWEFPTLGTVTGEVNQVKLPRGTA